MAGELVVESDVRTVTGGHLVTEDYDRHPRPCRHGIWIGWQQTFTQTVTLSFQHSGHPYVGWSVDGQMLVDPGGGSVTQPPGDPLPGIQGVVYSCPLGGYWHRISFTSTSAVPQTCFQVQVLFREHGEHGHPLHDGPAMRLCLAGSDVEWPAFQLLEERACLRRWWDVLQRYAEVAEVGPLDPVAFLTALPGRDLAMLQAAARTLDELDADAQPVLADALRDRIVGILRSRPATGPVRT